MKLAPIRLAPAAVSLRAVTAVLAVLLSAGTQWRAGGTNAMPADEWLRDGMLRAQATTAPETRLAVIDIDERSLATLGPWPWPRERLATLLELLAAHYGTRGIALDLVMPEAADAEGDARLAALARFAPLVVPHAFDYLGNLPLRVGQLGNGVPAHPARTAIPASGFIANHAALATAAHVGNIGFVPDRDGMIRHLPMLTRFGGQDYPTLSLALLQCCGGLAAPLRGGPTGGLGDGTGLQRLAYRKAWDAYAVIPAAMVLDRSAPADLLRDKLVLIGSSSLGLSDRVATPLSPSTSGMLVHAAALTEQLDIRDSQAPAPLPGRLLAMLFSVVVAGVTLYTLPRLSALANVAWLLAASALWLGAAWLLVPHDAAFSVAGPLFANMFLLAVAVPLAWQMAQRHSHRLLGTLRQYVAEAVVDELLKRDLNAALAPSRQDVTTLIADMEGYTGHVESLTVEQAAELTRDFLDCLTRPVLAHRGTLDKFTGDGLVTFWGAPLPVDDHADLALDAALAIAREVEAYNGSRRQRGEAPVRVRIGIESGEAMAGDFGSRARSVYTAVGDSVNVASRLETAARDLPYDIIVGPGTASRARRHRLVAIGDIVLRGRQGHTALYTLAELARPAAAGIALGEAS